MRFIPIAFAALLFLSHAAHSQTGCVAGIVVDNLGRPIKGMNVGLAEHTFDGGQQPAGQAVTDELGSFEIDGVSSGTLWTWGVQLHHWLSGEVAVTTSCHHRVGPVYLHHLPSRPTHSES